MKKRHRVLVIGVGSIGERHLRCCRATGRAELAILEVNTELRQQIAERYSIDQSDADFESALAARPSAAIIATPAPLHVPLASRLAEAGVHILIEKPLSTSLAGIDRLQDLVRQHSVTAGVAYIYRHTPLLRKMRQAIVDGRFGKPVQFVVTSGQHFPSYRPAYRTIYYNDRATGGGAIQDALTHLINAGEWLIGPVTSLVADAAHQVLDGVNVEDTVHLLTRHGSVLASYTLNQYQAPNEMTITLVCEQGTIQAEFHQNRWRSMTKPGDPWHDEPLPSLERDDLFIDQANTFLDAIEGKATPPCSLQQGLQSLRVNLAALASVDSGTWQQIYPDGQ